MSSKTKGRGRKPEASVENTQENVIGILNGDAEIPEEIVQPVKNKKETSKRKQAMPVKKTAAAADPEPVEVPAKRGRGRQAKDVAPEPKVEPSVPATKGKRGAAAKKSDPKAEPNEAKSTKSEAQPVENGAKSKGRGRGKQAPSAPKEEPEPIIEEDSSTGKRGTKRASVEKKNGIEASQINETKTEAEVAPTVAKRGRGSKTVVSESANSKVETEPEPVEKGKRGGRGGGKGKTAATVVEKVPADTVENGVATEKPGKKGAAKKAAAPAASKKRGASKKAETVEEPLESLQENGDHEEADHEEIITAAKKSKASKKAPAKSVGDGKLMNATDTDYSKIDFSTDKEFNFKISSWNIAGMRAWMKKGGLEYIQHEKPDILCLQETKCIPDDIPEEARLPGYHPYWLCKPGGQAGVGIYSKIMPINVEYGLGDPEQDEDGRVLTAEYEKFFLVCVYVPNAGRKLVTLPKRLRWNQLFEAFIQNLNEKKPVIVCGDMNVAHNEIDLANPKTNKKNAGFTPEEREGMTNFLKLGYVDIYRHFYPDQERAYTFWAYFMNSRAKDVGWRLDYFLVSERFVPKCVDNVIRSKVMGSDHCPITLLLKL